RAGRRRGLPSQSGLGSATDWDRHDSSVKNRSINSFSSGSINLEGHLPSKETDMATAAMGEVIQHLRRTALLRGGAGLTDAQLLYDYVSGRDETALEALVHRHGPMVWCVCRRVLDNQHDAEDAFQATFLVFVRKAASIASRELLASWLYGVAYQTARKARAI